jgi:hypothetical protein
LPLGSIARATCEHRQPLRQSSEQRSRREHLGTRRRELDRKRKLVEPAADLRDLALTRDLASDRPGALLEERRGVPLGERADRVFALSRKVERLAACDEEPEICAAGKQRSQLTCRLHHLLEVVQHQQ